MSNLTNVVQRLKKERDQAQRRAEQFGRSIEGADRPRRCAKTRLRPIV